MDKYHKLNKVGEGGYAAVFKCENRETGEIVAVKRFWETKDNPIFKTVALREVQMLRKLKHPNLINLIEVFEKKRRLHLVFEFCEKSVLSLLETNPRGLEEDTIKHILYQLLTALHYCHAQNCVHRDVKPENILLTKNETVKLCDFGFVRMMDSGTYTDYVATRWYRAPELLVGDTHYDSGVDVWGVGCVVAEMITGEALWPGKSDLDQIYQIKKTLGKFLPNQEEIFRRNKFFRGFQIPNPEKQDSLETKMPEKLSQEGLNFIQKCLNIDPKQRWSCNNLMAHPYLQGYGTAALQQPLSTRNQRMSTCRFLPLVNRNQLYVPSVPASNRPGTYNIKSVRAYGSLPSI